MIHGLISRHFTSEADDTNFYERIVDLITRELSHGVHYSDRKIDVLNSNIDTTKDTYEQSDIFFIIKF